MARTTIPISAISAQAQQQLKSSNVYDAPDNLPLSGNSDGELAYVSSTNRLYIWNGSGWYNIALINTSPSITGGYQAEYQFATDGTPIVVTLVGSDPEGIPLTWSYEVTSGSLTNGGGTTATVSNVDNVFTITPTTTEDYAGSFSLTFKASDGVNLGTAVSSFTLQFKIVNSNYTTLLAKGTAATRNATFVDSSTNAHTITANGDVYQGAFSPYRHGGYSMYFDGTGDVLYAAENTEFNVGVGDFTFESWIHPTSFTTNDWNTVFSVGNTTNFGGLLVGKSNTNTFCIRQYGTATIVETATLPPLNSWTHIACVRSSGTSTLYYNGVAIASATDSTNYTTATPFAHVGNSDHTTYSHYFNGYISNPRLVVGTAAYTSDFTPPTEPLTAITNTSLLINTPYIADSSTNAHTITVNGDTSTEPFSPFDHEIYNTASNGGSAYFDGAGDYLTAGNSLDIIGNDDWTIECWAYSPVDQVLVSNQDGGSGKDYIVFQHTQFQFRDGSGQGYAYPPTTPNYDQWNHYAIVKNGTTFTFYLNGVGGTPSTMSKTLTSRSIKIGAFLYTGFEGYFTGYMSNVRIVKGTAVYTANFTPPTSPLEAITNTSLLLNFTNAGIQDYSQVSDLKLVGNATGSSTQVKNAAYSMYFDGTGDYIIGPEEEFGGLDLTWEMWIKPTTDTQYTTIYSRSPGTFATGMWTLMINQSGAAAGDVALYMADYSGAAPMLLTTGVNVRDGSWHHVAVVRNGSSWVLYVDGTSRATQTWAGSIADIAGAQYIGYDQNYGRAYQGYIEDLRITKGLARYTANFTPPTTELLG